MPFLFDWSTFSSPNGSTTINDGVNSTNFTSSAFSSSGANNPGFFSNFGGSIFAQRVQAGEESGVQMNFSTSIKNLSFEIFDLDANGNGWDDQVQVLAYDVDGNLLTPTFSNLTANHTIVNGTTVEASGNDSADTEGPGAADSITVSYDVPVASVRVIFSGSDTSGVRSGNVGMGDFTGDVVCFGHDTLIETDKGKVAVQDLRQGDLVMTMDNGLQPIRWVGSRTVDAVGKFAPIVISEGVVGNTRELVLSPQHRVMMQGWQAELLFGEAEVLVAAKQLVNDKTIVRREGGEVTYYHILFDRHEVVYADDAPCESFHPGHVGINGMDEAQSAEIFALFPELEDDVLAFGPTARLAAKASEGALLGSWALRAA
ncbi:Hint domain-containing protein [Yoonia maritima]|uniref:Hint domain-containing protein n=1 Tax=Yoonia maritima TaxID=1435347 RepID=A0A2T0VV48_9RHOB|nr:Hint domain-containing protein [Yoonia maritima]PRY75441.1 Hint domain-containing protein [Yoonia maritima]